MEQRVFVSFNEDRLWCVNVLFWHKKKSIFKNIFNLSEL